MPPSVKRRPPLSRMTSRQREAYERSLLAISLMRRERISLSAAAQEAGTQPATVRALAGRALMRTRRGAWKVRPTDRLERRMLFYDRKGRIYITVRSSATASRIGEYHNAMKEFLETGDRSKLRPFRGTSTVDAKGKRHRFVTNPGVIRQLARAGEFRFESIY